MGIYRGIGGTGESTSDSNYAAVVAKAVEAAASATSAANSASSASSSASSAQGYATSAGSSATAAASSASSAAINANAASTAKVAAELAETNAETAEANAETAEANAEVAQAAAEAAKASAESARDDALGHATDAAASEANALQYASDAADSNTDAENHASAAATSATNAATSATASSNSATASANSAAASAAAKDAALAALDSFDDRYLGAKATDPSVDNDGNALAAGALYYNTTDDVMKVYEGSLWVAAYASLSGALLSDNNLSDLASVSASRANLGLGTAATTASTAYATAAQGTKADSALQINPALGTPVSGNLANCTFPTLNQSTTGNAATATTATNVSGGTASVTTLTTSSTVTHNAGTANGVAYLNGSKVLTTGSALTFDGSVLKAVRASTGSVANFTRTGGQTAVIYADTSGIAFGTDDGAGNIGNNYLYLNNSSNYAVVNVNGSEQMRLTSTGLGIGTTSPSAKLDIGSSANIVANFNSSNATDGVYIRFQNSGTSIGDIGSGKNAVSGGAIGDFGLSSRSGNLVLGTGSTERARIDSSGNLGLGVTPSAWGSAYKVLQAGNTSIYGGSGAGYFSLGSNFYTDSGGTTRYISSSYARQFSAESDGFKWNIGASGTAGNAISFTQAMTLDASGNLVLGDTSADTKFNLVGGSARISGTRTAGSFLDISPDNTGSNGVSLNVSYYGSGNYGPLKFGTGGVERARIDSSGNLLVGTTSNISGQSNSIQVASSNTNQIVIRNTGAASGAWWRHAVDSNNVFYILNNNSTGVSIASGATSWGAVSDQRLKTTVAPFENAVAKIASLRAGTGRYLSDDESVSRSFLIAQDVQSVLPEAVDVGADEQGTLSLRYTDTIPLLVAAIQEQQAIINQLQADVAALKGN